MKAENKNKRKRESKDVVSSQIHGQWFPILERKILSSPKVFRPTASGPTFSSPMRL